MTSVSVKSCLQKLIEEGEVLAQKGGSSWKGYSGQLQPVYLEWRTSSILCIEKLGEVSKRILENVERDEDGAFFYKKSALLVLGALKAALRQTAEADTSEEKKEKMGIDLFISHSSKDHLVAQAFVEFLEGSFRIPNRAVLCTSVPGYKMETSTESSSEKLRALMKECSAVVGLITPESVRSIWVGSELGAAWALQKKLALLVIPPGDYNTLGGPLGTTHLLKAVKPSDLEQLLDEIEERTRWEAKQRTPQGQARRKFVDFCKTLEVAPNP